MPDIDPDVRDRAAQAAEASMSKWGEHYNDVDRRMTLEVVDAVAEVLAADPLNPTWPGDDLDGVRAALALEERAHVRTQEELADVQARADLLTAALTDALAVFDVARGATVMGTEEYAAAESRARAALAGAGAERTHD